MSEHQIIDLPLPQNRLEDSHKGTYGRAMILGGSIGMSGAVALAGLGTLRGGAGLVYVAAPAEILPIVSSFEPSYITKTLYSSGESLSDVRKRLDEDFSKMDAIAIGPGLGSSQLAQEIVASLYFELQTPLVVDADALNSLVAESKRLKNHAAARILTPHPGEFARLIHSDTKSVQQNRLQLANQFARDNQVTLVLKGHQTIVTNGQQFYLNTTGNSGMSTGGTGDVLTGLITALLAQQMNPFNAAQLGVYLHGLAGDLAASELSKPALIASDLPKYLGYAWKHYLEHAK